MKSLILISLLMLSWGFHAQEQCAIKLIDSYSYEQIDVSKVKSVSAKNAQIDTNSNLILLPKSRGKNIKITSRDYYSYTFEKEFRINKHLRDTIVIQLTPVDSIVELRFTELFSPDSTRHDTLNFSSESKIHVQLNSYLSYLMKYTDRCDNGMCNYANTYIYVVKFEFADGVYHLETIEKKKPRDYDCASVDESLDKLKVAFPKFRLEKDNSNIIEKTIRIY